MALLGAWLRLELRRRWRSLTVLILLVGVSAGVVMTSLAAARRGASALSRLHERTLPATVALLPNTAGFDWSKIRALPEVAALSNFVVDYDIAFDGIGSDGVGLPFADPQLGTTVEKPVVYAGRMFDPSRADEAVVTRKFVAHYRKGVGDTVTLHLPSPKQLADSFVGATPARFYGPVIRVRIVGVVASPWISDAPDSNGGIQISDGLVRTYPLETLGNQRAPDNTQFLNALVRLKSESAGARTRFHNDVRRVTGRSDIGELDLVTQRVDIQHNIAFESRCLLAFAGAAFFAALFLVGQAVARYVTASTNELRPLGASGMTPRQATLTATAAPAVAGALGAATGVLGAWLASNWFPYGTADYFEPAPGRSWDWLVLLGGVALFAVLVATGAALTARLAMRTASHGKTDRRSAVATAMGRMGVGAPTLIGVRFALETGRGRTAVPVRPALLGSVTGVLGVVAAFTFSHGVTDAAEHPQRFGQTFQLGVFVGINGTDFTPAAKIDRELAGDDHVAGYDDSRSAVATSADGKSEVAFWEYERTKKPISPVVLRGHMPETADEVLLGPKTLDALHARVGGAVGLLGTKDKAVHTFRVTGAGLLVQGPHNGYADGGWISKAGYDALFTGFKYHLALVAIPGGAPIVATGALIAKRLDSAIPEADNGIDVEPGDVPTEVAEIRQVRTLPIILGGFLGLLAIGAVGHALATAVRRRSHDLAVLRALGMTPWQCRRVVITQASVLAVVGLGFGVPVGLAIGRTVWRVVADYTPLYYVAPDALTALLLVVLGAFVVANLLATWPGRRAARLRTADVLRAE
jgi:ABC-type lipoprotein release transport system permease subunit